MKYAIMWFAPDAFRKDWEEFDTREEADAALAEYNTQYPWNTYYLVEVVNTALATEKWKNPIQITYTNVGDVKVSVGGGSGGGKNF